MSNKVLFVQLKHGQSFVAKVLDKGKEGLKVSNPLMLVPQQQGMTLMPLMMFTESQEFMLDKNDVLYAKEPHGPIVDAYHRELSPIDLPAQNDGLVLP